jgi:CheY-like chemotaxis protein/anti-sigma regulatory factor (Ser/Thr protein kinase)
LLSEYFTGLGYAVIGVYNAEEALKILENGAVLDLILSDINLPGKSGLDLLRIIKATKKELPVVLLTGLRTLDNAISAVKNGAADYITKPFELNTVQNVVEKILKNQSQLNRKEKIYECLKFVKHTFLFTTSDLDPNVVARVIGDLLRKMQFGTRKLISQYELAIIEILQNAIDHGSLELSSMDKNSDSFNEDQFEQLKSERLSESIYGRRSLTITFEASDELFNFTVADEGPGFDWRRFVNESHQVNTSLSDVYGRGFKIISHIMDEVHFNQKGNIITVVKNRSNQSD